MAKHRSNHFFCVLSFFLIFPFASQAQLKKIGKPFIRNYERTEYRAGQQNWMIDQGIDGRIYFANNDGLLEFDGLNWNLIPLPKRIIVRSILATEDGRIYTGGFNEFGYFEPDSVGNLVYHSLINLLKPEDRDFDEIWRIHQMEDGLIFQSFKQLIIIKKNESRVIKAPGKFHFSYLVNGQLLVIDLQKGILRYSLGEFIPLPGTEALNGLEIWTIIPYKDGLLLATAQNGIYIYSGGNLLEWTNPAAEFLKRNQLFSAIQLNSNLLAFGTIQNGILICDNEGLPLQKINKVEGLQNNTILCLKKDHSENLWLGTDNGIDFLEINSPLSFLSSEHGLSAGYAAAVYEGILYLGTNQGVFYKPWDAFISGEGNERFNLIEGTRGQVWTLQVIDDHLFCGNNNGTYLIRGSTAKRISDVAGGWIYLELPGVKDKIIGGTYSGLILFSKLGDTWKFDKHIKGFNESSRLMEIDTDGSIWMSHGFKGVFHIFLNNDLDSVNKIDFYNATRGFDTDFGINVTRIKGEILFSSIDGVYRYNHSTDLFEKSDLFNNLLQLKDISKLMEDQRGNLWYFSSNDLGVLRMQEDGGFVNINLPFKQVKPNLIGGFEYVYPIDDENVLFGASNGFIHYSPDQFKDYQSPFSVFINQVSVNRPDSVIYSGHPSKKTKYIPSLSFRRNAIYFSFSANEFENPDNIEFSTFLEGYETDWSSWDNRYIREFTNLFEGDYTFYVKARNLYGVETEPVLYKFTINPPWARTWVAYIIYTIVGLLIILTIVILIKKKIERTKKLEKIRQLENFRKREETLQRDTLEAEKEIIRLRNEKLREQMVMKDKELANSTLETIQKNKFLTKITDDLRQIGSGSMDKELKNRINLLIRKISKELNTEKQWEVFETHFENVHEAFLKRLKSQFPELSPRELKLCAYLRLNISSKEIAVLMNISTRGVEISRYRLRKKLNLQRNENLTDFILSF